MRTIGTLRLKRPSTKATLEAPEKPVRHGPEHAPSTPAEALRLFRERYPVFKDHMPLKIGIHSDLRAAHPEISHRTISRALRRWTMKAKYQLALAEGTTRFDLHGKPEGVVTSEQQEKAKTQLGNPVDGGNHEAELIW
jgi:ProP effector